MVAVTHDDEWTSVLEEAKLPDDDDLVACISKKFKTWNSTLAVTTIQVHGPDHIAELLPFPYLRPVVSILGAVLAAVSIMAKILEDITKLASIVKTIPVLQEALHAACHLDAIQLLLEHGADLNPAFGRYRSALLPLHAACSQGYLGVVRLLPEHGADLNAGSGRYGSALHAACHLDVVQLLLEHGVHVDAQGGFFGSVLEAAAFQGHLGVVQLSLEHRAADAGCGYPWTALHLASYQDIVQLLIQLNANVDDAERGHCFNALKAASRAGHDAIVQLLLDSDAECGHPWTALQLASYQGHLDIVQLLIQHNANVDDAERGHCVNALEAALRAGHDAIVQLLLDSDAECGHPWTALQLASYQGHLDIVQLLIQHNANVDDAERGHCVNALEAASRAGHDAIVQLLLDHGAALNAQGGPFGSALKAAAWAQAWRDPQPMLDNMKNQRDGILRLLLTHDADLNAVYAHIPHAVDPTSGSCEVRLQVQSECGAQDARSGTAPAGIGIRAIPIPLA
ncbi:ankyrin repeat-containing domain protein [Mycena rebaudengoi]|nr:ankyrin repeat-containing domain protein [Mycena rebaudengoi]KAJ7270217.1 ankyrin repeat-containing domain protein [Mycena rebaudengoi]